jgi:hypothetical protein
MWTACSYMPCHIFTCWSSALISTIIAAVRSEGNTSVTWYMFLKFYIVTANSMEQNTSRKVNSCLDHICSRVFQVVPSFLNKISYAYFISYICAICHAQLIAIDLIILWWAKMMKTVNSCQNRLFERQWWLLGYL